MVITETNTSIRYVPSTSQNHLVIGINSFHPHKISNEVGKYIIVILEKKQIKNMMFMIWLAQVSQLGSSGT